MKRKRAKRLYKGKNYINTQKPYYKDREHKTSSRISYRSKVNLLTLKKGYKLKQIISG